MKITVLSVMVLLLVTAIPAIAEEQELTNPGIGPDSWLYGLSRGIERLQLILTWNRAERAKLHLRFAEKRLAELKDTIERSKLQFVQELVRSHEAELNETESETNAEEGLGRDVTELAEHVSNATYKHILVLEDVLEEAPDKAKVAIEHAINASSKGHERAIKRIEKRMAERAATLNSEFAGNALKRADDMFEKGNVEGAQRMLQWYMKKMNDTDDATERAEGLGKNVTLLAEHVCNMTYKHVYVLQSVLEKAPERAKPAIEKVINASISRHENCSESILERQNKTMEEAKRLNCTTDTDCLTGVFCPMVIGHDTLVCSEGKCKCGGKWEIVNKTEWRERFKEEKTNETEKTLETMKRIWKGWKK